MYTFIDKHTDNFNCPQKVKDQFAVYGILGCGTFGEVRLAFEKVSHQKDYKNDIMKKKFLVYSQHLIVCFKI